MEAILDLESEDTLRQDVVSLDLAREVWHFLKGLPNELSRLFINSAVLLNVKHLQVLTSSSLNLHIPVRSVGQHDLTSQRYHFRAVFSHFDKRCQDECLARGAAIGQFLLDHIELNRAALARI